MSAETLRRAADVARDEWTSETTGPFKNAARIHLAVADWLDAQAERAEVGFSGKVYEQAYAVARAYLGESA